VAVPLLITILTADRHGRRAGDDTLLPVGPHPVNGCSATGTVIPPAEQSCCQNAAHGDGV